MTNTCTYIDPQTDKTCSCQSTHMGYCDQHYDLVYQRGTALYSKAVRRPVDYWTDSDWAEAVWTIAEEVDLELASERV